MERNTISVVIPVYNRENLIVRCLDSIKEQTYRPICVVVVDNASTDNSRAVVEQWVCENGDENIRVNLLDEKRPGACYARNRGLETVDSEYTMFFDSDDVMHPSLLSEVMNTFEQDDCLDIVCWWTRIHNSDQSIRERRYSLTKLWSRQIYNSLLSTQSYAARTSLFRSVGAWAENLEAWNDWELGIRLLLADPKMGLVRKVLVDIYHQSESITGENFHSKAGIWEKSIDRAETDVMASQVVEKQRLIDMLYYKRVVVAAHYAHEKKSELAKSLLNKTLDDSSLSICRRLLLRALYKYTACGGRAAYLLWR